PRAGDEVEGVEVTVVGAGVEVLTRDQRLSAQRPEACLLPDLPALFGAQRLQRAVLGPDHDRAAGDDRAADDRRSEVDAPTQPEPRSRRRGERHPERVAIAG